MMKSMMKSKLKNKLGFTLLELIIVIVIIGILSAVIIPSVSGIVEKARLSSDKALVRNINEVITLDRIEGNFQEDAVYIKNLITSHNLHYELTSKNSNLWYDIEDGSAKIATINNALKEDFISADDGSTFNYQTVKFEEVIDGYILISDDGNKYADICEKLHQLNVNQDNDLNTFISSIKEIYSLVDKLESNELKDYFRNYYFKYTAFIFNEKDAETLKLYYVDSNGEVMETTSDLIIKNMYCSTSYDYSKLAYNFGLGKSSKYYSFK